MPDAVTVMEQMRRWMRDNRYFLALIVCLGLIRTAVADYNPVPSGSMHPNILEGDVVLVNRLAYQVKLPLTDLVLMRTGEPERGDIVTFVSPRDGTRLIKRLIGLPGDLVAMRDKRLYVNGAPVRYEALDIAHDERGHGTPLPALRLREMLGPHPYTIQWLAGTSRASDFGPLLVAPDSYLMLGDNRDNSADSRFIGLVPRANLIGRAERILVSAAIGDNGLPRFERFGRSFYDGSDPP